MFLRRLFPMRVWGFFSPQDNEDLGRRGFRVGVFQGEGN